MYNILCACEESQTVLNAFMKYDNVNVFSCDIQCCSGGLPGYHICADVLTVLNTPCNFNTQDGKSHCVSRWDLIIAFPPCTYLSCAGASNLMDKNHNIIDYERYQRGLSAVDFFMQFYNCNAKYVCIENPRPIGIFNLPRPTQYINPCFFGSDYSKRTYIWLKNLPPLMFTVITVNPKTTITSSWYMSGNGAYRQKNRSKFFDCVAEQMAKQWYQILVEDKELS